jgi:hypothetical protein
MLNGDYLTLSEIPPCLGQAVKIIYKNGSTVLLALETYFSGCALFIIDFMLDRS